MAAGPFRSLIGLKNILSREADRNCGLLWSPTRSVRDVPMYNAFLQKPKIFLIAFHGPPFRKLSTVIQDFP